MSHAKVYSATTIGLDVLLVEVEVTIESMGFPAFNIVGLADKGVDESKERVRASIKNLGLEFPDRRITVNLAPAELHKKGSIFDLSIAIGILIASEQVRGDFASTAFIGELSLDGRLRRVNGVLPIVTSLKEKAVDLVFLPYEVKDEASVVPNITVMPARTLGDVLLHLIGESPISPSPFINISDFLHTERKPEVDMRDIIGQNTAKRALEISAAGGHNIAMMGPPGSGKTMLARALPSILPNLSVEECLEVTKIYSVSGNLARSGKPFMTERPFRSPHHSTSLVGLVGGGSVPMPGEITLSHRGVLFVDEFAEMPKFIIDALRQPLEDGYISISRSGGRVFFPARFILVAAFNPCPCGYLNDPRVPCKCLPKDIASYQRKLSGPIIDRIDIFVEAPAVAEGELGDADSEISDTVRERVENARRIQRGRLMSLGVSCNAEIKAGRIKDLCKMTPEAKDFLKDSASAFRLSMRGFHKIIKVAQTIADLAHSEVIEVNHVAEALQYRVKVN